MGAIDFKVKGFRYLDSMFSKPAPTFVDFLRRYICDEHKTKKGKELVGVESWDLVPMVPPVPQQLNHHDCGVFTSFFADSFSAGKQPEFTQADMPNLRRRLAA